MRSTEAISSLIEMNGSWSRNMLSASIGMKPQILYKRMHARSVGVGFLVACLDVLGYRLVAMPKTGTMPKNGIVIDDDMYERVDKAAGGDSR